MPTLFTRIIDGEIPGVFVWRDAQCVVFLSINPMHPGHALVVPRAEVDHWIDLDPALAAHLFQVAQTIGQAQQAALMARRIGMMIVGDEVPHVHLHVVPFDSVSELSFAHADPNPPEGSLDAAAAKIRAALRDLGADAVAEQVVGMGRQEEWVARDAAVVWHGFTQMDAYAENAPILVERGEGHELIDVDGRRYLDAISSLWVNTLGHHVPELDDAVRAQLDRGAHSTMLGNGNVVVVELAEALARVVPVEDPHFLFASDGAAAVEQALKIAFQYWVNRGIEGHTSFLAFGGAYHGDTLGALSVGDASFGTDLFDPLRFPVLRAPQFGDPDCFDTAIAMIETHASELAAVIVEPMVQGAAGMLLADPDGLRALGAACAAHDVLLVCDEVATGFGRTGTLFASEHCGLRPDLLVVGKGITAGYLPMSATVASGPVFDAFLGPDLSSRTLYHGHSYSGNALAAAVALRHLELLDAWSVLENVQARSRELRDLLDDRVAPHPAVREVRLCGLMGGVELAPPADGLRWGRRVCAETVARGVLLRPLGDVVVLMPPLTVTSTELQQIVHTLTGALDEVERVTPKPRDARDWSDWAARETDRIRRAGQWRAPRSFDPADPQGLVSFASNDYLGLTQHPAVRDAARAAIDRWGTGAGAARLIVGSRPVHDELEAELAVWKGAEAAVLFATGFAANLGVLGTFGGPDTLVCSDELNHASLIDGRRLAGAPLAVYRHADAAHVDELLRASDARRAIVVTETVFSMDGDVAPVDKLADVCAYHGALLVLDEAHGVLGPEPDHEALAGIDHLRVGTLSKTLGALGGFVAGRSQLTDLLVNRARSYIFTTASTPADSAAALAALRIVRSPEGDDLRDRLRANVERLRPGHPSPIVPVVCGSEARALAAADALAARGLLVTAIRPPTVPPGTSRLRVALSAAHTPEQVDQLADALADLFPESRQPA